MYVPASTNPTPAHLLRVVVDIPLQVQTANLTFLEINIMKLFL